MTEVTLASLAMDFDVRSAAPATQQTDQLRASTRALEEQAKATTAAMRDQAVSQGLSGTAAGKAVQAMAPLVGVWGQARDALGRFTAADGSFRMSQDLTAKMLVQNANAATAYARQQEQAAKLVAKAETDAAREAQAAWKQSQAINAEIMRERVALARAAEREESQAARAAAKAIDDADRAAERSAQQVTSFRMRMARQRAAEETAAALEQARAVQKVAAAEEQAAKVTASYAAKVDQLRASLDPMGAVQVTLAQRTKLLDDALAHGAITADQHAAMLSKVTHVALDGVKGINAYAGGLKNGGQYATQFSFQLNDIVTGLTSGQKPMQVLAQQGGQVFQIFQMAAIEAGGFKAAIKGLTAEVMPLLATFGPWLAGLTAIGAAVFYLVDQQNKQAKAVEDATKRLDEQRKSLVQISPLLSDAKTSADLAAEGQRNFDEHVRKTNVSLAEQIRLQRVAALNETNEALRKAGEELRKNQEIFDKLNKPGTQMGFTTGVGAFSTISAADSVNKQSETFKKAAANLKTSQEDVDKLLQRLAKQGQAPDEWFGKYSEGANAATTSIRKVAEATDDYTRHAAPIYEDRLLKAASVVYPEAAAAAQAYARQQKALKDASNDNIKTFDEQTKGQIHFSSKLEIATIDMENAARVARELRFDIEDIGRAVENHDWASGFAGLFRVLEQVKAAFAEGATSAQKFAAISGLGQGLGTLIGGKTGAAISGAASGAQAGFQLGGPWGAAAGAALGGLTSILGSSAEKAQRKLDGLTKAVEDLRADNKTSSGSIAGALTQANASWNADLEYSSAMVTSLRSIDNQIGSLANAISRSITTGGLLSTSGLGLGTTTAGPGTLTKLLSPLSWVLPGLFGSKTKTELLDQGLAFNAASYGDILAGGVSGSTYADLATTKTKKFLGQTTSVKVTNSTVSGSIDGDLLSQITQTVKLLGDGVLSAAAVFGAEAAKAAESALGSAVIDLGKLSLKDLKPDEIAAVLQATFDKVGDQLAAAGVPGLDKLASVGEGAFETLTRLAREYQVVDTALASIGMAFKTVGIESIGARDNLVQLFGGADAFTSATSFFGQNFLTDAERLAPIIKAVNDNLAQFGLSATSTRDQFKNLVLGLDVSTESGAAAYKALLSIAPAFDKVAAAAEAVDKAASGASAQFSDSYLKKQVEEFQAAGEAQAAALETQAAALQSMNQALGDAYAKTTALAQSLREFSDSLAFGDLSGQSNEASYALSKQALANATGEDIPAAAQAFLKIAQERASTSLDYSRDVAFARSVALGGAAAADDHASNILALGPIFAAMASGNQAEIDRLVRGDTTGFATGGSFTVGGSGPPDSKRFNLALSPGEMVDVRRPGQQGNANDNSIADLKAELAAMRALLADIASTNGRMDRNLNNVTEGGQAMQTQAAS